LNSGFESFFACREETSGIKKTHVIYSTVNVSKEKSLTNFRRTYPGQGGQMLYFRTKNKTKLFFKGLGLENVGILYFMAILNILWPFGMFNGHFVVIW
jgi:hypothetical protein